MPVQRLKQLQRDVAGPASDNMPEPKQTEAFVASLPAISLADLADVQVINVDTVRQLPLSARTAGMRYPNQVSVPAVIIPCPSCGHAVTGLADCSPQYPVEDKDLPAWFTRLQIRFLYALEPCGCKVDQEWASSLTVELERRQRGNLPRPVEGLTGRAKQNRLTQLENELTDLHLRKDMADTTGDEAQKKAIDYRTVMVVDQICRLCPQRRAGVVLELPATVRQWAHNLQLDLVRPLEEQALDDLMQGLGIAKDLYEGSGYAGSYVMPRGLGRMSSTPRSVLNPLEHMWQQVSQTPIKILAEPNAASLPTQDAVDAMQLAVMSMQQHTGPLHRKDWLYVVLSQFETQRAGIIAFIAQHMTCDASNPGIAAIELSADIVASISEHLATNKKLTATAREFLETFSRVGTVKDAPALLQADSVMGPKPAPKGLGLVKLEEQPHKRKKRTIRHVSE